MNRSTFTIAALLLATAAAPALAADVSYTFGGSVLSDDGDRGWTSFTGNFTFNSLTPDGIPNVSTGAYAHSGLPYGMSITLLGGPNTGTVVSLSNTFNILISNNLGGADQFGALAQNASATTSLSLTLSDFTQAVFSSDALPLPEGGLSLASFSFTTFVYESAVGSLQGNITSFNCTNGCTTPPIPEPGTWALMGAGLLGVAALRRRQTAAR